MVWFAGVVVTEVILVLTVTVLDGGYRSVIIFARGVSRGGSRSGDVGRRGDCRGRGGWSLVAFDRRRGWSSWLPVIVGGRHSGGRDDDGWS